MEKRLTTDLNVVANSNLEIQLLDGDLNIIQKLDDEPNDVGGLTSAELKAKFDEGGNIIKKYINETLIPAVLTEDATEESRKQAEAARVAAEQGRVTAEEGRVSAETARAAAEQARSEAEASRVSAENARAAAETARADETAGIVARATEQANAAAGSASQAAGSEQSAKDAAGTATNAASSASAAAAAASGSASQASAAAAAAAQSAASADGINKTAQSWAVGGTGTRPGEDTDNAKYWAQQAQAAVGGDFATKVEAQGYVTAHNESDAAHPDSREALSGKAAATHASQHGKDGADPITPDAIGAIASTAKGTAGGVASLDADGKVPAIQLPTYTKDEILKDSTAALLGLGTDAVPDDAFKKLWEQATVSTKKYHVELCNLFLSNVTGIPSNQIAASPFQDALKTNSPDVSNVIIPNDLITIINSIYYTIYKLSTEEQWHRIDWRKDVAVPANANILFDYDGEYFYMIVGKESTSNAGNTTALDLKRTKDFKTFETLGTYYDGSYNIIATTVLYHINGDVYACFRHQAAQGASYTYMYCKLDKTSLTFTATSTEFVRSCGLYGKYSYKLANTSLASGKLTLQKTDVLTGTTQNIQVTATHNAAGIYCIPLYMSGSLYLILTSSIGDAATHYIGKSYTYCLVSHDDGATFEEYRFDNVLDGAAAANIVVQYNAISAQWYIRNASTRSIFKFNTEAFEKVDVDAPYFYYDVSMFIALDAETTIGVLQARYASSYPQVVMVLAFSRDLEMQGVSQLPSIQQLQMHSNTQDIPFNAIATFWISPSGVVRTFNTSTVFADEANMCIWTINQIYVGRSTSGTIVTGSIMPEID